MIWEYEELKRQAIEELSSGGFQKLLRDEVKRLPKLSTEKPSILPRAKCWASFDCVEDRRLDGVVLVDFSTPASREVSERIAKKLQEANAQ